MKQISFRVPDGLLKEIDHILRYKNYTSRSDLLRDLLRKWVEANKVRG